MNQHPLSSQHLYQSGFRGVNVEAGAFYQVVKLLLGESTAMYHLEVSADSIRPEISFSRLREKHSELLTGEVIIEEILGVQIHAYGASLLQTIDRIVEVHPSSTRIGVHLFRGRSTRRLLHCVLGPRIIEHGGILIKQKEAAANIELNRYQRTDSRTIDFFGGYLPSAEEIYHRKHYDLVIGIGIFCDFHPDWEPGTIFLLSHWTRLNLDKEQTEPIQDSKPVLDDAERMVVESLGIPMITLGGTITEFYDFQLYSPSPL